MQENQELPKGWMWSTIEEVCEAPQYGYTTSGSKTGVVKFLRTTDITSGQIDWAGVPYCQEAPADVEKYLLKDGDIVVSRAGSVGFSYLIKNPERAVFASYLIRFRPKIDEQYLSYFLLSPSYWSQISEKSVGIAVQNVNASKLKQIILPIPPLPEQRRIVAKLEELFSRLDAGVATLRQTQAQLKRYRQSVLHAAVTGELTRAWRAVNSAPAESGAALLERIRAERRAQWEAAQLAKRGGQLPLGDAWKKKYEEPAAPETSELPELPQGWAWATVAELATNVQYGTSAKTNEDNAGIPVYRMGNIVEGKLKTDNFKYLPQQHSEFPELLLEAGDILFNRTNSAELVGKSAVYKGLPEKASFASYLIRVQLNESANPDLLVYTLNSLYGKSWIKSVVTQQVGQANVNGTKLQAFAVPLPSIQEQEQIVSEVERLFSVLDSLEQTLTAELTRAERLRQSILHRAFTGRLVPQDAAEEPAAALLARLAEPAATPAAKGKRGRKPKETNQTNLSF